MLPVETIMPCLITCSQYLIFLGYEPFTTLIYLNTYYFILCCIYHVLLILCVPNPALAQLHAAVSYPSALVFGGRDCRDAGPRGGQSDGEPGPEEAPQRGDMDREGERGPAAPHRFEDQDEDQQSGGQQNAPLNAGECPPPPNKLQRTPPLHLGPSWLALIGPGGLGGRN